MSSCPLLATCDSAKVCKVCGGSGDAFRYTKSRQTYPPTPGEVTYHTGGCAHCHGTGRTCDRTECRILDAACDAIVPAERKCGTCGLHDGEPHEECHIHCEDRSHWQPPLYSSDNAPRRVSIDALKQADEVIGAHEMAKKLYGNTHAGSAAYIITRAIVAAVMEG